jgi:tetratricopeptide (TPR) repeat protein
LGLALKGLRTHRKDIPENSPVYGQLLSWFDIARQANMDTFAVTWSEVDYYDIRRDYSRLESLYQDILQRDDIGDYEKAVVRNNLAYVYAISDQGDKALATIGDAISQIGPRSDFLDTRGLAYMMSGKLDEALKDLRGAVQEGDGTASTYFHLALAENKSGNTDEAAEAIRQAKDMGLTEADLSTAEVAMYRKLLQDLGPQLEESAQNPTP